MMEYSDYKSQADTVKIEDITSDEGNATILRRLKENDPELTSFCLQHYRDRAFNFVPSTVLEAGWLGYFVGVNTQLESMSFSQSDAYDAITRDQLEAFFRGLCHNRTICRYYCCIKYEQKAQGP